MVKRCGVCVVFVFSKTFNPRNLMLALHRGHFLIFTVHHGTNLVASHQTFDALLKLIIMSL